MWRRFDQSTPLDGKEVSDEGNLSIDPIFCVEYDCMPNIRPDDAMIDVESTGNPFASTTDPFIHTSSASCYSNAIVQVSTTKLSQ